MSLADQLSDLGLRHVAANMPESCALQIDNSRCPARSEGLYAAGPT